MEKRGKMDGKEKNTSDPESQDQADVTQHKKSKPALMKFKGQSFADLSTVEWLFVLKSFIDFAYGVAMSVKMFENAKTDSAEFTLAIGLVITTVFLPVYQVHGVFMRMPYSIVLNCLGNVVLMANGIVYYTTSEDKDALSFVFLYFGLGFGGVDDFAVTPCFMRKYWKARKMRFPCGAETYNQDVNVKHLFAMSLLLLDLHLELTFVVLVLKIDETGLTPLEIVKLVGGVIYSIIMCVLGFLFLFKKWKSLVFIIPLARLIEVAYIIYNLINAGQTWKGFPDEVVPAFFIAVSIACLAVMIIVCLFLIYIYIYIRTEVDNETASLLQPELGE